MRAREFIIETRDAASRLNRSLQRVGIDLDAGRKYYADQSARLKKQEQEYKAQGIIDVTAQDVHDMADQKGIPWDNEPDFLKLSKDLTGVEHLDDMDEKQLQTIYSYLYRLESKVKESLDKPYQLNWPGEFEDDERIVTWAALPDGTNLEIEFQDTSNNTWAVDFYRGGSQEVTGQGDEQKVFATVMAAIKKFIQDKQPRVVYFSALKDLSALKGKKPSGSRISLYDKLVQKYAADLGYQSKSQTDGYQTKYYFTRINNMSEAWSQRYKRSINCSNPKGFSQRAHCQGRKKNEDTDDFNQQDPGNPIPFPKGTTSVDVSDPYDWYKLGMVISDLDDANPQVFGKGAPSTVIAFGSEEEEQQFLPYLQRLGLKIHDIDRPEDIKKVVPAKALIQRMQENFADSNSNDLFLNNLYKMLKQKYPKAEFNLKSDSIESTDGQLTVIAGVEEDDDYIGCFMWDVQTGPYKGVLQPAIKQTTEQLLQSNPGKEPALFIGGDNENPQTWKRIARNLGYEYISDDELDENFADGRNPQDKGDAKRHGINTKASVSSLRKTAKQGGRKGQLAHWLANMKSGRAKAKK